jgi:hypothetical protein
VQEQDVAAVEGGLHRAWARGRVDG